MIKRVFLLITVLAISVGATAGPLPVFVSVLPLKSFVEAVGGEHVNVQVMVRPGHSPDSYDPTPKQIGALADSALYIRVGVPFEQAWMQRIRAANTRMRVLDARDGIDLRTLEHHQHVSGHDGPDTGDHHNGKEALDPHIWTSPLLVRHMAANIRDMLTELDPDHGIEYRRNYERFAAELAALDREIRAILGDSPNHKFLVFHPAWGYFADTYGLTQIAIEREGKEPGARGLGTLIEQARSEGVRVIFVQPQSSKRSASRVAGAIGGRVVTIDPLAPDYANNLRRVARLIVGEGIVGELPQ